MDSMLRNKRTILFFILPVLIIYSVFVPIPALSSLFYSLFKWDLIGEMRFLGFGNFIDLFTDDDIFRVAFKNTFVFMGLSILLQIPMAYFLALMLTGKMKGQKFFQNIIFLPVALSGVAVSLIWYFIYHPDVGLINSFFELVGRSDLKTAWLSNSKTALHAVIISTAWQWVGYHMVLFIAGISAIPTELTEAAVIDGANRWQVVRKIILPLTSPIIKVSLVLITTSCLKSFDSIYIMTSGGPAHKTEVMALYMYTKSFGHMNYGYGSAIAAILLFLSVIFTYTINKAFSKEAVEM